MKRIGGARLIRMMGLGPRTVLLCAFLAAAVSARADLFSPNRPLEVLSTRWFDIVYPRDAQASAARLAVYADGAYREIAAFFGTKPRFRFPVVLTPDSQSANGYFTVWPHRKIVLYLAPTDPNGELGYVQDDLLSVFRHELAHAVSLTIRPPFWDAMAAVFGDPAGISYYTTPANLAEGAAIALEGPGGFGRAEDPLPRQEVRQDALEGRFKTFWASAGAWDLYPDGRVPYSYGGSFTKYLLDEYGPDLYRELWRRMGEGLLLPGLGDVLSVRGAFRGVYGVPLGEAWEDFEALMTPESPVRAAESHTRPGCLTALTASEGSVYYAEGAARRIYRVDARTGRAAKSYEGDASISRLDVSPDGGRLLVSFLRRENGLPRRALRELDLHDGRYRDLPFDGLGDAAYVAGGIAAIRPEPDAASLVLIRDGVEELLLAGSATVSYARPCGSPDGRWIYVQRRKEGRVSILRTVAPPLGSPVSRPRIQRLVLPDRCGSLRYLSVDSEGGLLFSWDDGGSYRLGLVRGGRCWIQTAPISGGVQEPASSDSGIYYLGYLSEGSALCSFPSDPAALVMEDLPIGWEDLDEGAIGDREPPGGPSVLVSRAYTVFPGLLSGCWFPQARLSSEGLWSAGVGAASSDPAELIALTAQAEYVPALKAASLYAKIELDAFAPVLALSISDGFSPSGSGALRSSSAELSAVRVLSLFGGRYLGFQASAGVQGLAMVDRGEDPYRPRETALALGSAAVSYGRWAYAADKPAGRRGAQVGLTGFGAYVLPPEEGGFLAGAEGALSLRALPGALALDLYGALSLSPGLSYGPVGRTFAGFRSGASYPEYAAFSREAAGAAYGYADAWAAPLVLEIQGRVGPIYLQRLVSRVGLRAAASGGNLLYSAYTRLTLSFAPLLGTLAQLRPNAWIEAEYAPEAGGWMFRYLLELPL